MDFGMPTLLECRTLRENLALGSQLGLSFLELNMNLPICQTEALADTGPLRSLADEYGFYFTIHLDENLDPFCFNTLVAEAWLQTALSTADIALELDAPVINMHMSSGIYFTLPDRREYLYQTHRDSYLRSAERFRDAIDSRLSGGGTVMCIENTSGYTPFQQEAVDLLLESRHFALTWDIGHSFCAGEKDEEFILSRSGRLHHMHLHDACGSKDHLTLGDGAIDLAQRFDTARAHRCRCVLETKTADALARSVKFIRSSPALAQYFS